MAPIRRPPSSSPRKSTSRIRHRRTIEWGAGLATTAFTPTFTIYGRVDPPAGITVGSAVWRETAAPRDDDAQGTLDGTADVPLGVGYHTITVTAFDHRGRRVGSRSFKVCRAVAP